MWLEEIPNASKGTIIDVRSSGDYELGHLKDAINIPWYHLHYYMDELKEMPKPWLFYSNHGTSAGWSVILLNAIGYNQVYNIGGWLDIEKDIQTLENGL